MRLNRIRLQNFRQHARSEIVFDNGITGIVGPNGSGKTTILEAIAWALYGTEAIRGTRETIRSINAPARAPVEVELDFELSGHRYRVRRGLTTAELYLDGAEAPVANSITGVTELLQKRLGMTRSEFYNTYFTGQKELSVMAAMTPSERAQFLSRVLGYERLRSAQELSREQRRQIGSEIAGLRQGMPDAAQVEREVHDARKHVDATTERVHKGAVRHMNAMKSLQDIEPRYTSAQQMREKAQRLSARLAVAEGEAASLVRETSRIDVELVEIARAKSEREQLQEQTKSYVALADELQRLDFLYREQGRRQTLVESEVVLSEEILRLRERYAKLSTAPALEEEVVLELEKKRQDLEQIQGILEAKRTEWVRDRQEAETKLQSLRQQYADTKQQRERIAALGADGICPTCSRALGESFQKVIEKISDELEMLQVDGNYYKNRLEQLENMPPEIAELDEKRRVIVHEVSGVERKLAKVQAAVQELPGVLREIEAKEDRRSQMLDEIALIPGDYDGDRHAAVRGEIERLTPLENRVARLGVLIDREPQLDQEQEKIARALAEIRTQIAEIQEQHDASVLPESEFEALKRSFEDCSAESHAAELEVVEAQAEMRNARQNLESAEEALKALRRVEERLNELQYNKRLHDELDRAFTDLRTDLNFQLRPELSELASAFISELTDDRYSQIELDDQYNVVVLEDGIQKPVISGGEEDLANLVLRLAISQMIAERAGQAFSLLILDEVFGSLDESRRYNVVELLKGLHDQFEQVILITHVEQVRDVLDHIISVQYDEATGNSIVTQPDIVAGLFSEEGSESVTSGNAA